MVMIIFNALSALFGAGSAIALFSNMGKGAEWPLVRYQHCVQQIHRNSSGRRV
jgi:hypothetical protein